MCKGFIRMVQKTAKRVFRPRQRLNTSGRRDGGKERARKSVRLHISVKPSARLTENLHAKVLPE
jgi:hypothetical protein